MIRALLVGFIKGYRLLLSPWLGASCRFEPTCSAYAIGAIETHGAAVGTYLTAARLVRCHPWCEGGNDPVPLEKPRLFTHLGLRSCAATPTPPAGFDPASQKKSS